MTTTPPRLHPVREYGTRNLDTIRSLSFRLTEMFLIAVVTAMFLTVMGLENSTVDPLLYNLAAAGAAGGLLGFSSRAVYAKRTIGLRFFAALASLVFCLLLMGWFTRGFVGISPSELPRREPDGAALAQIAAGAALAGLSLAARKPQPRTGVALYPGGAEAGDPAQAGAVRLSSAQPNPPVVVRTPVMERVRTGIRGWRKRPHKEEVRFVGAEEHRCPYCLQPIVDKDPRGVVTCPVCHTRHHKDCWAITGMCQIPHLHA
jgi:hypothetical protein